jgi:hypothetical protein
LQINSGVLEDTMLEKSGGSNWEQTLQRIRAEFLEMPGLRLTVEQAQRLWHIDGPTCAALLQHLVDVKFLGCSRDGRYGRLPDIAVNYRLPMAKATLGAKPEARAPHNPTRQSAAS